VALLATVAVVASKLMAMVSNNSTLGEGGRRSDNGLSHDRTFYVNGWQSWSFSGSFVGPDSAMPPYRLGGTLNAGFHSGGHPPPAISTAGQTSTSGNDSTVGSNSSGSSSSSSGSRNTNGGVDGWGILGELFNRGNAAQSATANSPEGYKVSHWFGVLAAPAKFSASARKTATSKVFSDDQRDSPLEDATAKLAKHTQQHQHAHAVPASTAALQTYEGVVAGCVHQTRMRRSIVML